MNSVCDLIEDNVYCVKFYVHAVTSDLTLGHEGEYDSDLSALTELEIRWAIFFHLQSVEDHLLLGNVWRYLMTVFMNGPRLELIYK